MYSRLHQALFLFTIINLCLGSSASAASIHTKTPPIESPKKDNKDPFDILFGRFQLAADSMPYFQGHKMNVVAEGFHLLNREADNLHNPAFANLKANTIKTNFLEPSNEGAGLRLGSMQDSFLDFGSILSKKRAEHIQNTTYADNLMKQVWLDIIRDMNQASQVKEEDKKKADEPLKPLGDKKAPEEMILAMTKENIISERAQEELAKEGGIRGGLKVLVFGSLTILFMLAGMKFMQGLRKTKKPERFEEERVPIRNEFYNADSY